MSKKIKTLFMLSKEDAGLDRLIVRVHNSCINTLFFRREAVVIVNNDNGKKIIRYAMGGSNIRGLDRNSVAIDYDGYDGLGVKYSKKAVNVDLLIRKAGSLEKYSFFLNHPDLSISLSIRLGLVGVILGITGLALGIISLL